MLQPHEVISDQGTLPKRYACMFRDGISDAEMLVLDEVEVDDYPRDAIMTIRFVD